MKKFILKSQKQIILIKKNIEYNNSVETTIRTIKGTNFDYFSEEAKNKFFNEEYQSLIYQIEWE